MLNNLVVSWSHAAAEILITRTGHIQPKTSVKGLRRFAQRRICGWRSQTRGGLINRMYFGAKLLHEGSDMQRIRGDHRLCSTDMVDSEVTCGCRGLDSGRKSILRSPDSTLHSAKTAKCHVLVCLTEVSGWMWPGRGIGGSNGAEKEHKQAIVRAFVPRLVLRQFTLRRQLVLKADYLPWVLELLSFFGRRRHATGVEQQRGDVEATHHAS